MIRTEGPNRTGKAWICLFTCFVTRAVHLDVVLDMSTETFIRCLKRFAARKGLPQRFISDNGKTFKAASRFLKSVFKEDTVRDHLAERGCGGLLMWNEPHGGVEPLNAWCSPPSGV